MPYDQFSEAFMSMLKNPTQAIIIAMVFGALLGAIQGMKMRS